MQRRLWGSWCCWLLLLPLAVAASNTGTNNTASSTQAPALQQQQFTAALPIIGGWSNLATSTTLAFSWHQDLTPLTSTWLTVPWGTGVATARLRATSTRVASASFVLSSGSLPVTNTDVTRPAWITGLHLQCDWGASAALPCGAGGWGGAMQLGPGATGWCHVAGMALSASWGTPFHQACRVVATLWNGSQARSGDFILDFAAPTRRSEVGNCLLWDARCSVAGTHAYAPAVSGAPQQVMACDTPSVHEFEVVMSGGFMGGGTTLGACSDPARITCTLSGVPQSTAGSPPPTAGGTVTDSLALQVTPQGCASTPLPLPPTAPAPTPSPSPPWFQDRLEPAVSIAVTKTYIVGRFVWGLTANSVSPTRLDIIAGSAATADYSITATRSPGDGAAPAKYLIEGVVSLSNPHARTVGIDGVAAVLPWGTAAPAVCSGLKLPGPLPPGTRASCSFRITSDLGPAAGSVSARVLLTGASSSSPALPAADAVFNFDAPDTQWATGACAAVVVAYSADPLISLALVHGGNAPAFAGPGQPAPACVCRDSVTYAFTVEFTPAARFTNGSTQVYAAATVAPVDSASNSKAATSVLGINVFEWPATWGPQPPAAKAQATTAIQPVQTLAGMAAAASGAGCGGAADDKCLL